MVSIVFALLCFLVFPILSTLYVYKYRGDARFSGPVEYFRKGWPIFAPLNVLLYSFSEARARQPIQDLALYPELQTLQHNWQVIRDEGMALVNHGYFDRTIDENSMSYYDVGFRTFFKRGWSKFYCKWYGTTHESAKKLCPKTVALLAGIPSVNGAMFTLLPPGSGLSRHLDPVACSLRYHLGLHTPNQNECFINIDGKLYSWRDGQALLFDETYLHFAENKTQSTRLILMCDVERPMFAVGRIFNFFYKKIVSLVLVPNLPGDKSGAINRLFFKVTPFLQWSKELKERNRTLYLPLKWTFNSLLLVIMILVLWGVTTVIMNFVSLML